MLQRKDFSSLRKRALAGVQPKNLLLPKVKRIGIPDERTINRDAICVVNPLKKNQKERCFEMKTCFFLPISIVENGLNEQPLHTFSIKSAEYNDISISTNSHDLEFRVSRNKDHLYFFYGNAFVDKMAIPKGTIDKILFSPSRDSFLVILHKRFGQVMVRYEPKDDEFLLRFFQKNESIWGNDCLVARVDNLEKIYSKIVKLRELLNKDPQTLVRVDSDAGEHDSDTDTEFPANLSSQSDLILKNGLPSLPTPTRKPPLDGRATRSVTRSASRNPESDSFTAVSIGSNGEVLVENDEEVEVPPEPEVPASFDPPLKYSLTNGKKFTIEYNDFKTLYNNDWINDTLIDFFIAYEIDKAATELKLIRDGDVYAFNSFFFTKLMSKPEEQEESPDYYGNIRRWLSKVDLMSYQSVIIPINEHLHWYCCIIKDLPKLLRAAKRRHNAQLKEEKTDKSSNGPAPDEPEVQPKAVAEVFVFDSLRHRHPNIEEPLRTIIDNYSQEKYGIPIPGDMIKFTNARVPQQRNFNDCGIHVICNVGKWLSEPLVCEMMWRKMPKKSRGYFNISERLLMRKKLIELLLELHKNQPPDESNSGSGKEEEDSDDEIELISYHSSKPEVTTDGQADGSKYDDKLMADGSEKHETEEDSASAQASILDTLLTAPGKKVSEVKDLNESSRSSTSPKPNKNGETEIAKPEAPIRTLDPRAKDPAYQASLIFTTKKKAKSGLFLQIEHPQIRRMFIRLRVKPHTVDFLNKFFSDHTRHYGVDKQLAIQHFVDKYNFFDPQKESIQANLLVGKLTEEFTDPKAPMDEPFVIQDADDSNGELNRSVGDLRIASDNPSPSDEEIYHVKLHVLDRKASDASDIEIVEDRVVLKSKDRNGHLDKQVSPKAHKMEDGISSPKGKTHSKETLLQYFSSKKSLGPKRRRLDAKSDVERRADKKIQE